MNCNNTLWYFVISVKVDVKYGKPNVAIFNSFNFISSFVFCIQLCVQYSTCIQHSTIHFIFYSLFTHSIIYLTISTIYSAFNNSFNIQLFVSSQFITRGEGPGNEFIFHEPSLFLVSHPGNHLLPAFYNRSIYQTTMEENLSRFSNCLNQASQVVQELAAIAVEMLSLMLLLARRPQAQIQASQRRDKP